LLERSKGRRQTKRDTTTDAGSSVISSDLKHRANDARDGSMLYCNVESKWKNCHIITFPGQYLSKNRDIIYARCFLWLRGEMEVIRIHKKVLDDLKDRRGHCHSKEEALDRTVWRNRSGRGFGPSSDRILNE
jgi:hypothetical protein